VNKRGRRKPRIKRMPANEADRHFIAGMRATAVGILQYALGELGYSDTEATRAKWVMERAQIVAKLREICADLGDNDWNDDLHLADVIDKHLWRHIETR
jgi:hypothetical protein